MGLTYCAYHYDVKGLASKEGLSEEEAGRKARYDAFADASKKYKCNKVQRHIIKMIMLKQYYLTYFGVLVLGV